MENTHCSELRSLVRKHKPDVLLVLEGNETWRKALEEINDYYPYQQLIPLENTYGMLFYSRFPTRQMQLFGRISGLLDPRIGRGLFSTFYAHYFFLRWPLDHVFVSHRFALNGIRRLPNCGSDHFPILVSLTYAPDPNRIDDLPQAEEADIEEMHEKLDDVTST